MTNNFVRLFSLGLLLSAAPAAAQGASGFVASPGEVSRPPLSASSSSAPDVKKWTMMVFMSGRNDLGQFTEQDINNLESAGSGQDVYVSLQVATVNGGTGATRYHILRDTYADRVTSVPLHVPSVDMGSKAALTDFVKWSAKNFPAERYILIIWGHGFGWAGGQGNSVDRKGAISTDITTGSSLNTKELSGAMSSISKILGKPLDILATDSCGMQMLSVVSELKKSVGIVIGSEDQVPADFGFSYLNIVSFMHKNPGASPAALSKFVAAEYREAHPDHVGVSAIDTAKVGGLVKKLNVWLDAVVATGKHDAVLESASLLPGFYDYAKATDLTENPMSKDIFQLVEAVTGALKQAKLATPEVLGSAKAVLDYRTEVVIANSQGDLSGLSEYVPKELYNASYDELRLSKISKWDDFVKWLLDPEYEYPKDLKPDAHAKGR